MIKTAKKSDDDNHKTVFAAIYARVSSPNQRFNYSIKEQVDRCWKYCDERGWIVRYVFVEAESGGTMDRPKFQAMLENAKEGKFDVIVFWKLDRFCWSLVDLVNIERKLREWGVGLCSITEYLDTTTSVGRFNFRNLASMAELEREMIGERARIGLHALAKRHKWPNPHPPLGYDRRNDGMLEVNREEAKLVRRIFRMYLRLKSMPQVAFELNKMGKRTKKGKEWNARAVRIVLSNGVYVGRYKVAGVEAYVAEYRILDDETFKRAGETMRRYVDGHAKRPQMPDERRRTKIEKVFSEYNQFLKDMEEEDRGDTQEEFFPLSPVKRVQKPK
jgi:site-specific DNA recombinase